RAPSRSGSASRPRPGGGARARSLVDHRTAPRSRASCARLLAAAARAVRDLVAARAPARSSIIEPLLARGLHARAFSQRQRELSATWWRRARPLARRSFALPPIDQRGQRGQAVGHRAPLLGQLPAPAVELCAQLQRLVVRRVAAGDVGAEVLDLLDLSARRLAGARARRRPV